MPLNDGFVLCGIDAVGRSEAGNVILEAKTSGKKIMSVIAGTKVAEISSSGVLSAGTRLISAGNGVIGATAGFALPSAHSGFTNACIAGCPASQTASTFTIPVEGLKVGERIVSYAVIGQIESGGNGVTVDASLMKATVAAANITVATIGDITQVSVIADTALSSTNAGKTLATPETVAADEQYYVLLTVTTGASCDVQIAGITITTDVP